MKPTASRGRPAVKNNGIGGKALRCAIDETGGIFKFSKLIGVSFQAVYRWFDNGVPAERAVKIERLTKGKVTRQELRPDIFC